MPVFDDSGPTAPRQLEPLEYTFRTALAVHTNTSDYLVAPSKSAGRTSDVVERFHQNNNLWEATIRANRLHHGLRIILDSFFLFEWLPRSPGLFWTSKGKRARADASSRIMRVDRDFVVYSPNGKQSMLDGGIGNIRLSPISLGGQDFVMMCASSSGVCHEGFPVALPVHLYTQCISEIRERGAVVRTLIGTVKLIPSELSDIYSGYASVPKLYLQVEEISTPNQRKSRSIEDLEVSVAVSFKGRVDGSEGVYATYANFDPSRRRTFADAVNWIKDEYVESYDGIILTDFDQQENHFPEARFSLKKVMTLNLQESDFRSLHIHIENVGRIIAHQAKIQKKTNYIVKGGNVGALGDNAVASNFSQIEEAPIRASKSGPSKRKGKK